MALPDASSIIVDLSQFKLHIYARNRLEVSLHFDSPSRRFYLAVIALVIKEMKNNDSYTSMPMAKHYQTLALFNETVGGQAGSSEKEKLLSRIYRKWKDALPDLEFAPLFKVIGRRKEYGDAVGRAYRFADLEKDCWANLFEYTGSGKNVRLKFSIDKLGLDWSDVRIVWDEATDISDKEAWDRLIETLQENRVEISEKVTYEPVNTKPEIELKKEITGKSWKKIGLAVVVLLLAVVGVTVFWKFYLRSDPSIEPTASDKIAFSLPDKPSIAVLPFKYIGGGHEKGHIADGITDTLINNLFRVPQLFVIARNSVYQYKDKAVDIRKVSEQLGVRHVLEGSVQISGPRLRVNVQLIDAITAKNIWAEGYDSEMKDLFAMQDNITKNIITFLRVTLTSGGNARLLSEGTDNIDAYLKLIEVNPSDCTK